MKHNIRSKISDFLTSEDGHVGVKSPLALGAASASLLLAHAMVSPTAQAHFKCYPGGCPEGEYCIIFCDKWSGVTCVGSWHSHCEPLDS